MQFHRFVGKVFGVIGSTSTSSKPESSEIELDEIERSTYRRHLPANLCESVFTMACWSGVDIAIKRFNAEVQVVILMTMMPGVLQFLSLFASGPVARVGRRRLLRWSAVIGRSPIVLVYFISGPYSFLLLLCLQATAQVFVTTSWNSLLSSNYRASRRGILYARVARWGSLVSGITMIGFGFWLKEDPEAFRYGYVIAGVLGVVSCFIFSEIPVRSDDATLARSKPGVKALWGILKEDRSFRRYEIGFFLYGLAFMAIMTAKPVQFADSQYLDFSYPVLLGAKGAFSLLVVLATLPMGRAMDRLGPAGMAGRCYFLLAIYCVLLIFVTGPWQYLLVESLFGVAMAGVMIAWNMGPVTLAPTAALAGSYMLIHVALVGVRAAIAHPIGGWIVKATGDPRWVFGLGFVLLTAGTWVMLSLAKDLNKEAT